jgi:hypothetical protein
MQAMHSGNSVVPFNTNKHDDDEQVERATQEPKQQEDEEVVTRGQEELINWPIKSLAIYSFAFLVAATPRVMAMLRFCLAHHAIALALPVLMMMLAVASASTPPDTVGSGPIPPTLGVQYAGLVTVNATTNSNMFYWFFESTTSGVVAEQTPIILWLEGGPGIAGTFQTFYGMGPYRFNSDNTIGYNNYTWLNSYHLLFVDNPCGVGYSVVNAADAPTNEIEVAEQVC